MGFYQGGIGMIEGELLRILRELGVHVKGINSKGWVVASCPFAEFLHDRGTDRDPSFNVKVNPSGLSGFWCFTCKQNGKVSTLARKLGRYREEDYNDIAIEADFAEAVEDWVPYDGTSHFDDGEATPVEPAVFDGMFQRIGDAPRAKAYLRGRGIGPSTSKRLGLAYDAEERRIVFPVKDVDGNLYGYTGRSILPNPVAKVKDYAGLRKDRLLLGEHLFRTGKPVLVVEGLFALARVVEVGGMELCNPVATMGSHMGAHQADRILDLGEDVFILYDNDEAGRAGVYGRADKAGEARGAVHLLASEVALHVCDYPEGLDDVDDITFDQLEWMLSQGGSSIAL
jgi:hypothetical protein